MFILGADDKVWTVDAKADTMPCLVYGYCRSAADGKRKAEKWLRKRMEKVME